MSKFGPKSIRGRAVLTTVLVSAVAMAAIVAVVGWGMFSALRAAVLSSLEDRLDVASSFVEEGDFENATDGFGNVLIVLIDSEGNLISANSEKVHARAIKALLEAHKDRDFEIEDLDLDDIGDDLDDDDDERDVDEFDKKDDSEHGDDDDDYDDDSDDYLDKMIPIYSLKLMCSSNVCVSALSVGSDETGVEDFPRALVSEIVGKPGPFLVAQRVVSYKASSYTLVAIGSIAEAVSFVRRATVILGLVFMALLGAIAWFTWIMSGRTLAPVEQMRQSTEDIISSNLASRIPVPTHDADLAPLAETFNDVIARMEADLDAQRRFISDASHELKSPVAAMGIILETISANPDSISSRTVLADLLRENLRMQGIVNDLLTLARYDEGRANIELAPVDMIDLVFEQVSSVQAHSDISFDTSHVAPVIARVDERLIRHALSNMLNNAERFASSSVRVGCTDMGSHVRISVSDDGPGIALKDRERVFDRFVRLDQSSKGKANSTGLGLAVVREIATAHGGRAYFSEPEIGGATIVLELPA